MGKKHESTTVIGRQFTVHQLPASRAYRLLVRLMKHAGPALGELLGVVVGLDGKPGAAQSIADLDLGGANLARVGVALQLLFDRLTPQEADEIRKELLEGALVDEQPLGPQFDDVFAGEVYGIIELQLFALKVNFGSFSRALDAARAKGAKMKSNSAASSTSAGQQSA